jgi:HTH-type transcriptional regulator/antitoxin HigA
MIRALEAGLGIPAKALIQKPDASKGLFRPWSDVLVREMSKRGYFGKKLFDGTNKETLLAGFFNGHDPAALQLAWRKTHSRLSVRTDNFAALAWAEFIRAKGSRIAPPVKYKDGTVNLVFMQQIVQLSVKENGPLLAQKFLEQHGIVLIVAEHLPKTHADAVTILTDKEKPIIGLSLRYDRIDNFWFTLLHELAHIRLHLHQPDRTVIIDELDAGLGIDISQDERDADALAQEAVVPASKWAISPAKIIPSPMAAQSLANELGVHVAVVAGFIQYKHQSYIYLRKIIHADDTKVRHMFKAQLEEN